MAGADFVRYLPVELRPDPARTVIRPFVPGDPERYADKDHPRAERIVRRVLALTDEQMRNELARVRESLDKRHRDVRRRMLAHYRELDRLVPPRDQVSEQQQELIAAYFSAEYSYEAAALFNPSVVEHPDQSGAGEGGTRFVMSLRGIGEGHMSSVTFRTGTWHGDGNVTVDEPSERSVAPIVEKPKGWHDGDTIQLDCRGSREPSETVLFPVVARQSRGLEDLRLMRYTDADGTHSYGGTFTALGDDGVRQEMLRTDDFREFKMHPVVGELADSKGMALFPRQIDGRYWAIGRQDNENLWLLDSDQPFTWNGGRKLLEPAAPWEFIQIGNCGSPIEIDEGWLLLTHGVGVVRNYCIGAALLDRDDPSRVLGRLGSPLIEPTPDDRDGYVPNVVYSCGALARDRELLLPFGIADNFTSFATVPLDDLVRAMTR